MDKKGKGIIEQMQSTNYIFNDKLTERNMEEVYRTKKITIEGKININCLGQKDTYTIRWKDKYMVSKDQCIRFSVDTLKELAKTIYEEDFDKLTIIM